MKSPLRLFLMTRKRGFDWKIFVSQYLEDAQKEWARLADEGPVSGVLHVGFGRPAARTFNDAVASREGILIATGSAKSVLSPPSKLSENVIDVVSNVQLYLVVDGWGYTLDDPTKGTSFRSETSVKGGDRGEENGSPKPSGWILQFLSVAPEFEEALEKANIYDEQSYLGREYELPGAVRTALGQFRVDNLAEDRDDPLNIVKSAPPWLRSQELEQLPLTVRLRNVFHREKIKLVSDLDQFTRDELFWLKNFGKTSYRDLTRVLQEGLRRGAIDKEIANGSAGQGNIQFLDDDRNDVEKGPTPAVLSLGLMGNLLKTLNAIDERDRDILLGRMGFKEPPKTLEELGNQYEVTRERIRQIEKRSLEHLIGKEIWDDVMRHRLTTLLDSREEPLPLFGLEVVDDWFRGTSEKQDVLTYLIEKICENRFYVLKIGTFRYVSRIDQETWDKKLREARQLLESVSELNWREDDCRHTIETFLSESGKELAPLLWTEASRLCHFTGPSENRILTAYGRGIEQLVQVVLEDSQCPLHTSEVANLVSDLSGKDFGESQIRNPVANVGFLLGRGIYGLRKHVQLSDDEIDEVAQLASEIIAEQSAGRQWHTSELVSELRDLVTGPLGDRLDKYNVNVALQMKSDLKYLGRLVWTLPDTQNEQRIDLRDAVIEILEQAGGPLSTREINERLSEFRGVNSTFQIWSRDPILKVGRGLWGLNDRDFLVKRDQQPEIAEMVLSALRRKGVGIHLDEIKSYIDCDPSLDAEAIFSIAALDDRISIGVGRFIYIKEWGDSRRLTLRAALQQLMKEMPGPMNIVDIKDWLEFKTERRLDNATVSHSLSRTGAIFLGDGIWQIQEADTEVDVD
ncbi:DNA-directed RNA polymerase subunit alpha C-terminal domain-containing protein [Ruegeria arenilitoris]|uniref:DNA-directed RNA polymerase subunit alpha C-terminal domain-containing protein n=1 Tax=Ruegeria arenilitoris TaxID=1173585 RepID=UPI00147BE0A7|nr:DNA-directed RNA polymerase subunit alpha C-terminal domain-containing protein [Ruegeria arenilitoris]